MLSMRECFRQGITAQDVLTFDRGCEPLTPDDVAEVIVFAAGMRENVVIADTLIFPNHQASATIMHRKSN